MHWRSRNLSTALVKPAGPRTVAPNGTGEPPTERAAGEDKALDESAVLRALDVD